MTVSTVGANSKAAPVLVSHLDLERVSNDSLFRSWCPSCKKGMLLVQRDQGTFRLINVDRCTLCGQTVIYTDKIIGGEPVEDVRES
jgi:thiol-disulfide isomerase/thioredoxin